MDQRWTMRMESTREKGNRGEALALEFLRRRGLRIEQTGYRFGRNEIDIIACEGEVLVFCEVKSRSSDEFGEPEYALTPRKQATIRRVAEAYLFEHGITDRVCRFDVVAIRFGKKKIDIRYHPNAF